MFGQNIFGSGSEITPENVRSLDKNYLQLANEKLTVQSTVQQVYESNQIMLPLKDNANPKDNYIDYMKKNGYTDEVFHPKF